MALGRAGRANVCVRKSGAAKRISARVLGSSVRVLNAPASLGSDRERKSRRHDGYFRKKTDRQTPSSLRSDVLRWPIPVLLLILDELFVVNNFLVENVYIDYHLYVSISLSCRPV